MISDQSCCLVSWDRMRPYTRRRARGEATSRMGHGNTRWHSGAAVGWVSTGMRIRIRRINGQKA